MNTQEIRIALVRLSALGDIVNSAVVLQFIKAHCPNAQVEWITEEAFAPLLEGHPLLDAVHAVPLKRIKKSRDFTLLKETISALKRLGPYDHIIDMQGLLKSAVVARLIGSNVHGFDRRSAREGVASLLYKTTTAIAYEANVIERNCRVVGDALGFEITPGMLLEKESAFPLFDTPEMLRENRKNIVCVIGASWPSKQYPKEHFLQLCEALNEHCIIVWGSEEEHHDALWIAQNCSSVTVAPPLNLKALCGLIARCDLLIGNDTGPTHMAWAQNVPSITLFGPTTPRMIYETASNVAVESHSAVNINKIDKNDFSIRDIDVESIVQEARKLL